MSELMPKQEAMIGGQGGMTEASAQDGWDF